MYKLNQRNAKPVTLRTKSLSDFLAKHVPKSDAKKFRKAVLEGPFQISPGQFKKDLYWPNENGIPVWRLGLYCRLLGIAVDEYIKFCGFTATVTPIFETPYEH